MMILKSIKTPRLLICLAAILLLLCACGSENDRYVDELNDRLVSFTDCANAFSDSLEAIAEVRTVPTETQITEIESRIDALSAVCMQIEGMSAPDAYAERQAALGEAMRQYADALEKCRALLEFYRSYDEEFRSYATPDEGSAQMKQKAEALYAEFAQSMQKANIALKASGSN